MPNECEGLQGFPVGWTMPDKPPEDTDELDTMRYHAVGNAVTVSVAQWLAERIRRYLDGHPLADGSSEVIANAAPAIRVPVASR